MGPRTRNSSKRKKKNSLSDEVVATMKGGTATNDKDDDDDDAETTAAAPTTPVAPLSERRAFAETLFHLSKEELGKVLVDIEMKYPQALRRNAREDEVEINVDQLPSAVIADIQNLIQARKKKKIPTSNKKAKTTK